MVAILEIFAFIFSAIIFSLLFWKNKNGIFLFRSLGLCFSLLIVFTFNINWLLHKPINLSLAAILFILIALLTILLGGKERIKIVFDFSRKNWVFILSSIFFCLFLSFFYFEGDFGTPRYTSPDSAGHYLYMLETAQTGFMPLFLPNKIFPASGNNPIFIHHHDTHFPGASVIYFIFVKILPFVSTVTLLQIFNAFLYFACFTYFLLFFKKYIKEKIFFYALFLIISFGFFFDMFSASYTNQLFGLFLLLFFIDSIRLLFEDKISIFAPVIGLSAVVISYIYWFPAAVIFTLLGVVPWLKKNFGVKKILLSLSGLAIFILLVTGYIIAIIKAKLLGYATEGGFDFVGYFWIDSLLVLPILIAFLYQEFFKKDKENNTIFVRNFFLSFLSYSLLLLIAFLLHKSSIYSLNKSAYITVPTFWTIGFIFLDSNIRKINFKKIKEAIIGNKRLKLLLSILFTTIIIPPSQKILFADTSIIFFPEINQNFNLIFYRVNNHCLIDQCSRYAKFPNISKDQLKLLDELKTQYSWTLKDNRIPILAPPDIALWVFAYSGIWPRTYSMIPDGRSNEGIYSPMSFYSKDMIDYGNWLKQDNDHIIAIFDSPLLNDWIKTSGFSYSSYKSILSENNNYLLKIKPDATPIYFYNDISNDDYASSGPTQKKNLETVETPFENEIVGSENNLSGISFYLSTYNNTTTNNYKFELYSGDCLNKGKIIVKQTIPKESIVDNNYYKIRFDKISDSKGQTFCYKFKPDFESGSGGAIIPLVLWIDTLTNKIELKEIYQYTQL